MMWEEQENGSQAAEASGSLFVLPTLWRHTDCVSITEQTAAKSYLFVLYDKKKTPELNR
jgi:hypothetical protein